MERTCLALVFALTGLGLGIGTGSASAAVTSAAQIASPARPTGVCVKSVSGALLNCPRQTVGNPSGARNTSIVAATPSDLAALVDTRTWTSGGGNTFTGADVPYGMVQWAPETSPHRAGGGGYTYADTRLFGYSLTHVSGPGCTAAGDVPILPLTGSFPADGTLTGVTAPLTHTGEIAQAGYYSAVSSLGGAVTTSLTATPHSGMAAFTYPPTASADLLIKLRGSQNGDKATGVSIVNNHEVAGWVVSGNFCERGNYYKLYFDLTFNQTFSKTRIVGSAAAPAAVELSFNTTRNRTVGAKAGISYVSVANARLDWQKENSGKNFSVVKAAAQAQWNALLGKIAVSGGTYAKTQEFYSLLYKDFLQPNVTSDVNGQYMGSDDKVHKLAAGQQNQYGMYSGWDIYHSLSQLQALLTPRQASDMVTSQLNYYAQNGQLQQWGYLNTDVYAMIGDPADAIIADIYAFGGRSFNAKLALTDMLAQADSVNHVRPGEALEASLGYLPEDGYYGCCYTHSYVSSLLEYDNADFALARFASSLGDTADATRLQARAGNWANVYDPATELLNPRLEDGAFVPGVAPTSTQYYAEGSAYEYLWDVPGNYAGLFSLLGGDTAVAPELEKYLSAPNGTGPYAMLTDEFDLGEQYAPDYAADPAGSQRAVNDIRWNLYQPGPYGLANNDDLGGISSQFIWEMLGFYPENPGSDVLVFASPGFPQASIELPNGHTITISAPGASQSEYYVQGLTLNGAAYNNLYTTLGALEGGATLDFTLGTTPGTWGTSDADVPPSYGPVYTATTSASSSALTLRPGASTTDTVTFTAVGGTAQTIEWDATPASGVTVSPASGTVTIPAGGTVSVTLTLTAGAVDGAYKVNFAAPAGGPLLSSPLSVTVARPGNLTPFWNVIGISADGHGSAANWDNAGYSYSEQALTAAGLGPGKTVRSGGLAYVMPAVVAGAPDGILAEGQAIPFTSAAGATRIGFLGSATSGGTTGSSGTVTITYTDGTTSAAPLTFSDWTLDGGKAKVAATDTVVARLPYRNTGGNAKQALPVYMVAAAIPVTSGKTVADITLPAAVTPGRMGLFAITSG